MKNPDKNLLVVAKNNNSLLLLLHNTICLEGGLDVHCIHGSIFINNSFELKESKRVKIYSQRDGSYVKITPNTKIKRNINSSKLKKLQKPFFLPSDQILKNKQDSFPYAILVLKKNESLVRSIGVTKYAENIFNPNSIHVQSLDKKLSEVMLETKLMAYEACEDPFLNNPQWDDISFENCKRLMVVGGKNVGKTTFAEYIINKLFSVHKEILLIDLDIGQPILTVPQVMSATILKNPIFSYGKLTEKPHVSKAYFFGDVNPSAAPFRYIKCVSVLIRYCETHFKNLNWVINTMGFNKGGLGIEITTAQIKICNPDTLIQIQHQLKSSNFTDLLSSKFVNSLQFKIFAEEISRLPVEYRLYVLDSVVKNLTSSLNAIEKRSVLLISGLASSLHHELEWFSDLKPFCIPLSKINILSYHQDQTLNVNSIESLNGNFIYLCKSTREEDALQFLGVGYIRSIDLVREDLFIVSSLEKLNQIFVDTIVITAVNFPISFLLKQSNNKHELFSYIHNVCT